MRENAAQDETDGADSLDHESLLAKFDALVQAESITWAPSKPVHLNDSGFQCQFHVCSQMLRKPQLSDRGEVRPGESDISNPPSFLVAVINTSHILTYNAYPVLRPSFLLLTVDPSQKQIAPLNLSDIQAAFLAMERLRNAKPGREYMVIYNGGPEAGCSRLHKHLQVLPCLQGFTMFPDVSPADTWSVPFVYELIRHPSLPTGEDFAACLYQKYLVYLQRAHSLLGSGKEDRVPHNLVMTRRWSVIIPRRRAQYNGLGTNAMGMMGVIWVSTQGEMLKWKLNRPTTILEELGVAADNTSKFNKT